MAKEKTIAKIIPMLAIIFGIIILLLPRSPYPIRYLENLYEIALRQRKTHVPGVYRNSEIDYASRIAAEITGDNYLDIVGVIDETNEEIFACAVASHLANYGMKDNAVRLLEEYGLISAKKKLEYTLAEMERLGISPKEFKLKINRTGITLTNFKQDSGASIALGDYTYGEEDGNYEILPRIEGHDLTYLGFGYSEVIGYLTLDEAVDLARAATEKDAETFKQTLLASGKI